MTHSEKGLAITSALAGFASGLHLENIPFAVVERAKLLLLDSLASAMTGWTSPEAKKLAAGTRSVFGEGGSTIIGGIDMALGGAVMVNGYLITARSICDMHQPTLCHVTPAVVPPLLAVCEREGVDGATMLTALCAGMEATVRVGLALDYPLFRSRGWHTPGVAGPIGAVLGVARALRFDEVQAEQAMGIAGSQAGGTFASFGTPTIKFHQARAAWSALISAELLKHGFEGPTGVLDASDGGILRTFSSGGEPGLALDALGESWQLMTISLRLWPGAAALQSLITIVNENEQIQSMDIESVEVSLPPANFTMNAHMGWDTTFEATLSARFVTALAMTHGSIWLEQFAPDVLQDPEVNEFALGRVAVICDPTLPEGGSRLRITSTDGNVVSFTRDHPRGSPDYPASWEDIADKMLKSAADLLQHHQIEAIIESVRSLEDLDNVGALAGMLRRA